MHSAFLGSFLVWLRGEEIDVACMLARYGLSEAIVGATEIELDHARYCDVLADAERSLGEPALGLRFARQAKRVYSAVEALLHNAPDIRTAMRSVRHFNPPTGGRLAFRFDEGASFIALSFSRPGYANDRERVSNEFLVAWFLLQLRLLAGFSVRARQARFTHAAPDDLAPYREMFGDAELRFGERECALVCDPDVLDLPIVLADPEIYPSLAANVRRLGKRPPLAPSAIDLARVQAAIRRELPRGRPSAAVVAKALSTSVRSLQRALRKDDTTFAAQVDVCRKAVALELLSTSATLLEIGTELGFGTESSFFRAFRRWYGTTPSEHRRGIPAK